VTTAGSERPFGLTGPLGSWRPLDRWVVGYALATLPFLGYGWLKGAPGCAAQGGVNALVITGCLLLARWSRDTRAVVPTVLRLFQAPIIYWAFYHQIQTLWPLLHATSLDGALVLADQRLFGCQPSLAFRAALPHRWLSEILCFAYFAYYFFTPVVGFTALFRSGYAAAERIILAATATFFLCYALFWLLPTVGPHFWFPPGTGPRLYDGYLFNHGLFFLTSGGEIRGGAFPSSHLAVALLYTLWARREVKVLFLPLAVVTALMVPAVVYLRAHYMVDVPAGLATGVLAYWLSVKMITNNK
jgi:membrane-associated phospholipid phosphatase